MIKNYFFILAFFTSGWISAQHSLEEFVSQRNLIARRTTMMSETIQVILYNLSNDTIASIEYTPIICLRKNKLKCVLIDRKDPNIQLIKEDDWEAVIGRNYQIFMNKSGDYYYFRNWKLSEDELTDLAIGIAVSKWKWYQ